MISLYQFGTFDVSNYGDLLFPLLTRKRLEKIDANVIAVSPTNKKPIFKDHAIAKSIDDVEFRRPAAVLIGGGNIIHLAPTRLRDYYCDTSFISSYPDLWVGSSCLADLGIPVCWNAPGVPGPFSDEEVPIVRDCLKRSTYISVRGHQSREFLFRTYPEAVIEVVPDPAWEISGLWTGDQLAKAYEDAFVRRHKKPPHRSIAVHLNSRYMTGSLVETIAQILDKISISMDVTVILIGVGPCHGDDELARQAGFHMKTLPLIIDQPESLMEVAACIACSKAYAGSSMHGFITASAFGVPGICVVNGTNIKFQELKAQFDDESILADSWQTAAYRLPTIDTDIKRANLCKIKSKMLVQLDSHWNRILKVINQQKNSFSSDEDIVSLNDNKNFLKYRVSLLVNNAAKYVRLHNDVMAKLLDTRKTIAEKELVTAEKDQTIINAKAVIAEKELNSQKDRLAIARRDIEISRYRQELYSVYTSRSWRYTAPLRRCDRIIRSLSCIMHTRGIRKVIKGAYFMLPQRIRQNSIVERLKTRFKRNETIIY